MISFNINDFNIKKVSESVLKRIVNTKYSYRVYGIAKRSKITSQDVYIEIPSHLCDFKNGDIEEYADNLIDFLTKKVMKSSCKWIETKHSKIYIGLSYNLRRKPNIAAKTVITTVAFLENINK